MCCFHLFKEVRDSDDLTWGSPFSICPSTFCDYMMTRDNEVKTWQALWAWQNLGLDASPTAVQLCANPGVVQLEPAQKVLAGPLLDMLSASDF